MWEDKKPYINHEEAVQKIASELGLKPRIVRRIIYKFFINLIAEYIPQQKIVRMTGFGKLTRTRKGNALFKNRVKNQVEVDRLKKRIWARKNL